MGFIAPDQDALEQARDAAQAAHNDFWANNGYTPEANTFFPGFEAGWHAAIEKLVNGEELPGDLEAWAREHYGSLGTPGSPHWEFEHGFRQGAEAVQGAGRWEDDQQEEHQEEEHHEEE